MPLFPVFEPDTDDRRTTAPPGPAPQGFVLLDEPPRDADDETARRRPDAPQGFVLLDEPPPPAPPPPPAAAAQPIEARHLEAPPPQGDLIGVVPSGAVPAAEATDQAARPAPPPGPRRPVISARKGHEPKLTWVDAFRQLIVDWRTGERTGRLTPELVGRIPLAREAQKAIDAIDVQRASQRITEGRATPADWDVLERVHDLEKEEQIRGTTFGYRVATGLLDTAGYAAEFALAGWKRAAFGVAGLGGRLLAPLAGRQAVRRALSKLGEHKLLDTAALRGAEMAGRTLEMMAVSPEIIAETAVEKWTPSRKQIDHALTDWDDDFGAALAKAVPDVFVEWFSEQTGEAIGAARERMGKALDPLVRRLPLSDRVRAAKQAVMARWLAVKPGATVTEFMRRLRGRLGWHGILNEIAEERVADLGHELFADRSRGEAPPPLIRLIRGDPTTRRADDRLVDWVRQQVESRYDAATDFGDQLLLEFATFSLFGSALGAVGLAADARDALARRARAPETAGATSRPAAPPPPTAEPAAPPPAAPPEAPPEAGPEVAPPPVAPPEGAPPTPPPAGTPPAEEAPPVAPPEAPPPAGTPPPEAGPEVAPPPVAPPEGAPPIAPPAGTPPPEAVPPVAPPPETGPPVAPPDAGPVERRGAPRADRPVLNEDERRYVRAALEGAIVAAKGQPISTRLRTELERQAAWADPVDGLAAATRARLAADTARASIGVRQAARLLAERFEAGGVAGRDLPSPVPGLAGAVLTWRDASGRETARVRLVREGPSGRPGEIYHARVERLLESTPALEGRTPLPDGTIRIVWPQDWAHLSPGTVDQLAAPPTTTPGLTSPEAQTVHDAALRFYRDTAGAPAAPDQQAQAIAFFKAARLRPQVVIPQGLVRVSLGGTAVAVPLPGVTAQPGTALSARLADLFENYTPGTPITAETIERFPIERRIGPFEWRIETPGRLRVAAPSPTPEAPEAPPSDPRAALEAQLAAVRARYKDALTDPGVDPRAVLEMELEILRLEEALASAEPPPRDEHVEDLLEYLASEREEIRSIAPEESAIAAQMADRDVWASYVYRLVAIATDPNPQVRARYHESTSLDELAYELEVLRQWESHHGPIDGLAEAIATLRRAYFDRIGQRDLFDTPAQPDSLEAVPLLLTAVPAVDPAAERAELERELLAIDSLPSDIFRLPAMSAGPPLGLPATAAGRRARRLHTDLGVAAAIRTAIAAALDNARLRQPTGRVWLKAWNIDPDRLRVIIGDAGPAPSADELRARLALFAQNPIGPLAALGLATRATLRTYARHPEGGVIVTALARGSATDFLEGRADVHQFSDRPAERTELQLDFDGLEPDEARPLVEYLDRVAVFSRGVPVELDVRLAAGLASLGRKVRPVAATPIQTWPYQFAWGRAEYLVFQGAPGDRSYLRLIVLDRGLFMGEFSLPVVPEWDGAPDVVIDVVPAVPATDLAYPFRITREGLTSATGDDLIHPVRQQLIRPHQQRVADRMARAWDRMTLVEPAGVGRLPVYLYDVGQKLTPEETAEIVAILRPLAPVVRDIVATIARGLEADPTVGPAMGRHAEGVGFVLSRRLFGLTFGDPRRTVQGRVPVRVLVNPFQLVRETPNASAAQLLHVLAEHESSHLVTSSEGEQLVKVMVYPTVIAGAARLINWLSRARRFYAQTDRPDESRFAGRVVRGLEIYTHARDRQGREPDDFFRETSSPFEPLAPPGGEAGDRGGAGSAGPGAVRPRVTLEQVRKLATLRGTGLDAEIARLNGLGYDVVAADGTIRAPAGGEGEPVMVGEPPPTAERGPEPEAPPVSPPPAEPPDGATEPQLVANVDGPEADPRGSEPRHYVRLTRPRASREADREALALLSELWREGRLATADEQAVLARYTGEGATPEDFAQYLTEAERARVGRDRPLPIEPEVARAIWGAIETLGFDGGLILDATAGTGEWFTTMPPELAADEKTRLVGLERDPVAAAVAQQLAQDASILPKGLAGQELPPNWVDLSFLRLEPEVGAAEVVAERNKDRVDQIVEATRPGGLVVVLAPRSLLHERSDAFRRVLAARADLLIAVRLRGGRTLLILRRREAPPEQLPDWVSVEGRVFDEHPEWDLSIAGEDTVAERLWSLVLDLPAGQYQPRTDPGAPRPQPEPPGPPYGRFVIEGDRVGQIGETGEVEFLELPPREVERVRRFIALRDQYQAVVEALESGADDRTLASRQKALRRAYEVFSSAFGPLASSANRRLFSLDPESGRLRALEQVEYRRKGRRFVPVVRGLGEIASRRVVTPRAPRDRVETAEEALVESLTWQGRIDPAWMMRITGRSWPDLVAELGDRIYQDPTSGVWVRADEYLSGDVVTALDYARLAAAIEPRFARNVEALEAVQPPQKSEDEIDAIFGAPWVPTTAYARFLSEQTGRTVQVWRVNTGSVFRYRVEAPDGTEHALQPTDEPFETWVEDALHGRMPVKRTGGRVDPELTETYRASLEALRESWATWWRQQPAVAAELVDIYNRRFNRYVPFRPDGSELRLPLANPSVDLRPWQLRAIWRGLRQRFFAIFHTVGAGKSYVYAALAVESRRLGLARKPLIVVPNQLLGNFTREFLRLYPTARILVPTAEDFQPARRKVLLTSIARNDWDAVVLTRTMFGRLPVGRASVTEYFEAQRAALVRHLAAVTDQRIEDVERQLAAGGRFRDRLASRIAAAIRQLEDRRAQRLATLTEGAGELTFEQLGIDLLIADESHEYKNLYFATNRDNIAGLKPSDADRALDMHLKVTTLRGQKARVVIGTGTPITNTMAELYIALRLVGQELLARLGLEHFDAWAQTFAMVSEQVEAMPGGGYTERLRLKDWRNLGQLYQILGQVADVFTREDFVASGVVQLPALKGGRATTIVLPASEAILDFMRRLRHRVMLVRSGAVPRQSDNMLSIVTDAALATVDLRLVDPTASPDPDGRIARAAAEIASRYRDLTPEKGVQLVFLDVGVPHSPEPLPDAVRELETATSREDEPDIEPEEPVEAGPPETEEVVAGTRARKVDLYGELKRHLIRHGVPADEIVALHQARNETERLQVFEAVRRGVVRVFLLSRAMGALGLNVQDRVAAVHHVDVPWVPHLLEQADGRAIRQGNRFPAVEVVRYVTERTFDEYRWGLLATKREMIGRFLRGEVDTLEDIDPAQFDMQIAQALASGNPDALRLVEVEREVKRLQIRQLAWSESQKRAASRLEFLQEALNRALDRRKEFRALVDEVARWTEEGRPVRLTVAVEGDRAVVRPGDDADPILRLDQEADRATVRDTIGAFFRHPNARLLALQASRNQVRVASFLVGTRPGETPTEIMRLWAVATASWLAAGESGGLQGQIDTVGLFGEAMPLGRLTAFTDVVAGIAQVLRSDRLAGQLEAAKERVREIEAEIQVATHDATRPFERAGDLEELLIERDRLRESVMRMSSVSAYISEQAEAEESAMPAGPAGPAPPPAQAGGAPQPPGPVVGMVGTHPSIERILAESDRRLGPFEGLGGPMGDRRLAPYQKVIRHLAIRLGFLPIATGKTGRGNLGIFKHIGSIRLKLPGDIKVLLHELGHAIDIWVGGWSQHTWALPEAAAIEQELLSLGEKTSRKTYTRLQRRREGVANYVVIWMADAASARARAPAFTTVFEAWIQQSGHPVAQAAAEAASVLRYLNSLSAEERLRYFIKLDPGEPATVRPTGGSWFSRAMAWLLGTYDDPRTAWDRIRHGLDTDLYYLQKAEEVLTGAPIDPRTAVAWQAFRLPGAAQRATGFVDYAVRADDFEVFGPGLRPALAPILDHPRALELYRLFAEWLVARRAIRAAERNKMTGVEKEAIDAVLQRVRADPDFAVLDEARRLLFQHRDAMLSYLQHKRFLGPETRRRMERAWLDTYIPWVRIYDRVTGSRLLERYGVGAALRRNVRTPRAFRRFRGAETPIADPLTALHEDIYGQVAMAEENFAMLGIIRFFGRIPGGGRYLEVVPPDVQKVIVDRLDIQGHLRKANREGDPTVEAFIKSVGDMTVWIPRYFTQGARQYLTARDGDQLVMAEVHDPGLWEIIQTRDPIQGYWLIRALLSMPVRAVRATATLAGRWIVKNWVSDIGTLLDVHPEFQHRIVRFQYLPRLVTRGLRIAFDPRLREREAYQLFLHSMAGQSTFASEKQTSLLTERLKRLRAREAREHVKGLLMHPWDAVSALYEAVLLRNPHARADLRDRMQAVADLVAESFRLLATPYRVMGSGRERSELSGRLQLIEDALRVERERLRPKGLPAQTWESIGAQQLARAALEREGERMMARWQAREPEDWRAPIRRRKVRPSPLPGEPEWVVGPTTGLTPQAVRLMGTWGRDNTQDFHRMGAWIRWINRYWEPFVGANIGGVLKWIRVRGLRPRSWLSFAVTFLVPQFVLALMLADDDEYWELDARDRQTYIHIPIPRAWRPALGIHYLRIRRVLNPTGSFQIFLEEMVRRTARSDRHWFEEVREALAPMLSFDWIAEHMLTLYRPLVEVAANWNFYRRRPIVVEWDEWLDPELQVNRWTTSTAQALGRWLHVSPAKIDHLLYSYGTSVYLDSAWFADQIAEWTGAAPPGPARDITRLPVLSVFLVGPAMTRHAVDDLMREANRLEGAAASVRTYWQQGEYARARERAAEEGLTIALDRRGAVHATSAELRAIRAAREDLRGLFGEVDAVMRSLELTPAQKRERLNRLTESLTNRARTALGMAPLVPLPSHAPTR